MTATMAGGGDWLDLPTAPVQHRGAAKPAGLPWDRITEEYVARGGQVDAAVWPKVGKVVTVGQQANSRHKIHTWEEAVAGEIPPVQRKAPAPKRTTRRRKVLTAAERATVARKYADGESTTALSKEFEVSTNAITNAVIANGGRLRTLLEAADLRWKRSGS